MNVTAKPLRWIRVHLIPAAVLDVRNLDVDHLIRASAPILAGFTLPTITLLATSTSPPPLREPALWAFTLASGCLLCSVHISMLNKRRSVLSNIVAFLAYMLGVFGLVAALFFTIWPGHEQPGSQERVYLVIIFGAVVIGTPVVISHLGLRSEPSGPGTDTGSNEVDQLFE